MPPSDHRRRAYWSASSSSRNYFEGNREFIGWCCTGIKEELPPPNREIVFAISRDHRSMGYTTQAVQATIKYLFEHTKVEELNAVALTHNLPSNKVIQKCGFDLVNRIEIDNEPYNHYKIRRSQWIQ
ncbi:GNAT family N-acetyltransferase [Paenibacillus sp. 32O-W]|uniref:GNAT family N-acetyltransferase n=1 Tax=Paenibacillus sp. 32O-W TaxID=1695218 RepID=UPI0028D61C45|nr:GNAT family N-acetyltransferase [Paenibacillus sp. 32O-W]